MDEKLGQLEKVDLHKVWKDEAGQFTPWLAQPENLKLLGDTLSMEFELVKVEKEVGRFFADIECKDTSDGSTVLIENQIERTDHTHLGQILTYAAGLEAATVIWIAERFTEEHRAALDWLNEITGDKFSFFGLEMELWRIGDSPVAPKFSMVSKPNDWTKGAYPKRTGELTAHQQLQLELWTAFKEYMTQHQSDIKCQKPLPQGWMWHPIGRAGIRLASITSIWDSDAGIGDPEVRVELTLDDDNSDAYFEALRKQKVEIEQEVGQQLTWYASKGRTRRIYLRKKIEFRDRTKWPEAFEWLRRNLELFYKVFAPRVKALKGGGEA